MERTAYEIIASEMKMLGGKINDTSHSHPAPQPSRFTANQYAAAKNGMLTQVNDDNNIDDDIPF